MSVLDEQTRARRVRLGVWAAVAAVVLVLLLVGLVNAAITTRPPAAPRAPGGPEGTGARGGPTQGPGQPGEPAVPAGGAAPASGGVGWDVAGEDAVAARPMLAVAAQAAAPQSMGTRSAGPPMVVPAATVQGPVVGEGFPPSPEGAVGQLAALDTAALSDLNPLSYAAAYRSVSLPGAPAPESTALGAQVTRVYDEVAVNATNPTPIASRWQLAGAQVKGVTDGGRFVVACVLGELQAAAAGSGSAGVGDCQALRFVGGQWRISPTAAPVPAPDTWPGSDLFARAGYRPIAGS